ncbi:MAG: hypothetical protein Kow0047_33780 [Anaerolineae bacterium]
MSSPQASAPPTPSPAQGESGHPDHRWLTAYYDGELAPEAQAKVHDHVQRCIACQDNLRRLDHLRQLLSRDAPVPWEMLPSSQETWQQLARRLPHDRVVIPSWVRWLPAIGLLLCYAAIQMVGVGIFLAAVGAALGLIHEPSLDQAPFALPSPGEVLSWMTLRGISEPLAWAANLVEHPLEWDPLVEFALTLFVLLSATALIAIAYLSVLALLHRRRGRQTRRIEVP